MTLNEGKCSRCGKVTKIVSTDNKLVGDLCLTCIGNALDFDDVKDLKMLSETLKIPFNPNKFYLAQMQSNTEEEALEAYFEYIEELDMNDTQFKDGLVAKWDMINDEWQRIRDYHGMMLSIPVFKDEFMSRNASKWGYAFSFEQQIRLESLYTTTLKTYNITDPIRRDAVKKAAITSVRIDDLIFGENHKDIKELTTTYQNFLKIANIDHVSEQAQSDDTITTVADLISYLELKGYHIQSDYVEKKDVVDMTLDNILENTRLIVSEKTGIDVELSDIIEKAQANIEGELSDEVFTREALADDLYEEVERELERDLEATEREFDMEDVEFLGG